MKRVIFVAFAAFLLLGSGCYRHAVRQLEQKNKMLSNSLKKIVSEYSKASGKLIDQQLDLSRKLSNSSSELVKTTHALTKQTAATRAWLQISVELERAYLDEMFNHCISLLDAAGIEFDLNPFRKSRDELSVMDDGKSLTEQDLQEIKLGLNAFLHGLKEKAKYPKKIDEAVAVITQYFDVYVVTARIRQQSEEEKKLLMIDLLSF